MKVALDTLGCKLNQAETELLARQFIEAGHQLVPTAKNADIYVLNTCIVTHVAESKSRHLLRLANRRNPRALLVATGCYAELAPQELTQIKGVRFVLGNKQKPLLLELLKESGYIVSPNCGQDYQNISSGYPNSSFKTRTLIKIQDGCNSSCAYCIVPKARGKEKSIPANQIINGINDRVAEGYKEVILTGVKIGSYNYNKTSLRHLLERILAETNVARVRISSLQPQEITSELIKLWSNQRLCRHFHLSLQSGSDKVLSHMNRFYSVKDYRKAVSLIREHVPEAALTTDIIVGFPGESPTDFEESCNFCQDMDFARIHVFPYSPRQETEAAHMPQQVGEQVKRQRSQKMLSLAQESISNFSRKFIGRTMPILWEKETIGIWSGHTDNYIKVYTKSNKDLTHTLSSAKLVEVRVDGVWGEVAKVES